jgi:hypothetical protein
MFSRNDGAGFLDSSFFMDRREGSTKHSRMKIVRQKP